MQRYFDALIITPVGDSPATLQHLGAANKATATPVLASFGDWVVAVWTETEHDRANLYAATSGLYSLK